MRVNAALVAIRSAKPSYPYGQLAKVSLTTGTESALVRASIPADVPEDAIVTKAELVFTLAAATSGSRTISVQPNGAASWSVSTATWNNKPVVTGSASSEAVGAQAAGTTFAVDVTADAQSYINGTAMNRGWRLTSGSATATLIRGATAADGKPYLELEYEVPGDTPAGLSPNGAAVSVEKPTLTFATAADSMVALQVQVDAAADEVSPDFDSGEVPATTGTYALAGTLYPGLALGATTSWRARIKTALGWSDYSDWASFSRVAKPVVTITSPGATTGDKTPPITWTAPGQVEWQAALLDAAGKVLAESPVTASADLAWTPPKGLTREGQTGTPRVRVRDAEDRVATPGDPTYAEATSTTTLVAAGLEPGVTNLAVSQVSGISPIVRLDWRETPVSDAYEIARDSGDGRGFIWLERLAGPATSYLDYTADPGRQHRYKVLRVSDGVASPNGPTATITPVVEGIWLMDPEDDTSAVILGQDAGSFEMVEQTVTHDVLGSAPVRRRSAVLPPSGAVSGLVADAYDRDGQESLAALYAWKVGDPGRVVRLVVGDWNIPVTVGNINVGQSPQSRSDDLLHPVAFAWWQTRDELPWDD